METIVTKTNVYPFDELSKTAQANAIQINYYINVDDGSVPQATLFHAGNENRECRVESAQQIFETWFGIRCVAIHKCEA